MQNAYFLVIMVYITQVIPALLFKFGSKWSSGSKKFLFFYLAGNTIGAASMLFAMKFYGIMEANPNLAGAITGGGAFIATQVVFGILFYKDLNWQKILGVIIASAGLCFATLNAPVSSTQQNSAPQQEITAEN